MLELVRKLALLGYYEDFADVKAVLEPILGLLEGSDDLPYKVHDYDSKRLQMSNLRFLGNFYSSRLSLRARMHFVIFAGISTEIQSLIENYRSNGRYINNVQNTAMVEVKIKWVLFYNIFEEEFKISSVCSSTVGRQGCAQLTNFIFSYYQKIQKIT